MHELVEEVIQSIHEIDMDDLLRLRTALTNQINSNNLYYGTDSY